MPNSIALNCYSIAMNVVSQVAQRIVDRAMQVHGAGGLCQDFPLARMFSWARILRLADGPDEVHRDDIAKLELKPYVQKMKASL